jgi:uncharacterized protein with PIN domain
MLGKLTRWLRILGHDVAYSTKLDDDCLITVSKRERRALLTRDLELFKRATAKGIDVFYVGGKTEEEKLARLAKRFGFSLDVDMTKSRCPKCNAGVRAIPKGEITKRVEKNTLSHYDEFWRCPKCGQIYWQGAHWSRIDQTLGKAKVRMAEYKDSNTI